MEVRHHRRVSLAWATDGTPTAAAALPRAVPCTLYARRVDLSDYQRRSRATALYPGLGESLTYPALGLCGEAGEAAEQVKKALRDDAGTLTPERRGALEQELGDVLWYLAQLATEAGLDLGQVAVANLDKLAARAARGTLHGSGDDR